MTSPADRFQRRSGFTLLELILVVSIIGALAAVAIPLFLNYQLRSKTAEVKANLAAIRSLQNTYFSERDVFLTAGPEPPVIPGAASASFDSTGSFAALGFSPEGRVYFSYGASATADGAGHTADAGADLDGDGFVQFWGIALPDGSGVLGAGLVGCNVAGLTPELLGPCSPGHGTSIF
jgi:type IV pilus assembly protein PilA